MCTSEYPAQPHPIILDCNTNSIENIQYSTIELTVGNFEDPRCSLRVTSSFFMILSSSYKESDRFN